MTARRTGSAGGRTRREKGTGSITSYQTRAGRRWRYEIEVPIDPRRPADGTRTVSRAGFASYADAEDGLTLLRADTTRRATGRQPRHVRRLRSALARRASRQQRGTRLYIQRVLEAMDPYIGSVRMADIRPTDLAAAYRGLENGTKQIPSRKRRQKGLAPSTAARYANWVNSVFLAAVDEGLIHKNPANSKHAGRLGGPAKPGVLGVLQAEHNLLVRLSTFPDAMNLRLVVDSQRLLSAGLVPYAERIDPDLAGRWSARAETYSRIQRELRNVGGRLGNGKAAAGEAANAVSRLKALLPETVIEPRMLGGFQTLFRRLDSRITDILESGVERGAFVQRVTVPRLVSGDGRGSTGP